MQRRNNMPFQTFPACSICEGRGFVNYQNVIKFDCPACHYERWDARDSVQLLVTEHNAKRLRAGYPSQTKYEPKIYWKRAPEEWKIKAQQLSTKEPSEKQPK
jgi:hypothetical protein